MAKETYGRLQNNVHTTLLLQNLKKNQNEVPGNITHLKQKKCIRLRFHVNANINTIKATLNNFN